MNDPIPPQEPGTPHDEPAGTSDVDFARHPLRGPRTPPASDPDPELAVGAAPSAPGQYGPDSDLSCSDP